MSVEGDLQHSLRIGDTVLLYVKDAHGYVFSELSRYAPVHLQRAVLLAALCGDTCSPHTFSPSAAAPSTTPWQLPPAAPFGSPTWPTCTVSPCTPQRSGMAACVCMCVGGCGCGCACVMGRGGGSVCWPAFSFCMAVFTSQGHWNACQNSSLPSPFLPSPPSLSLSSLPPSPPFQLAVATFCVVAANKNKAQERLTDLKKRIG